MKHAVQITTADDGAWVVTQLVQKQPNGEYTRIQKTPKFIPYDSPNAGITLLDAITKGLKGKLNHK
jgi:hypothetical protein